MGYIIGQYNHNNASADDNTFMTPITSGVAKRRDDMGYSNTGVFDTVLFANECVSGLNLVSSEYYYFRCQIKRMNESQQFVIKLVNYDDTSSDLEQYIKTITIQGGDRDEWVNVDFIFNPIVQFDTVLFQLKRTISDYRESIRYPKIAYVELGSINNLITREIGSGTRLLKIGVQGRPGLEMCVNGEEIHVSRTGVFEVKNGVIPVTFFSVVNPATEEDDVLSNWIVEINQEIEDIEDDTSMTDAEKEAAYAAINSNCFFGTNKSYSVDAFTLDYMYNG